ncbi:MAG: hypothetical protein EXS16_13100 [Gemmataceae bacterium]|nr:hypothetical protein [Gemmataceae bacterium]
MFRKLVCAMFVMTVSLGLLAAEEIRGVVTKVDGDKVTVQKFKKGEKGKQGEKDGDPIVITVAKDAKIAKAKFADKKLEAGEALADGLKNEIFTKIGEKGVGVRITTDDTSKAATQILVVGKKKKDAK